MAQPVRFSQSYNGYDPKTIFYADQNSKTLIPFASGDAYTGSGYQFGQEQVANPADYAGYNVGSPITRADQLAQIKGQLNQFQNDTFNTGDATNPVRKSSALEDSIAASQKAYDADLAEFGTLKTKLEALNAPNYEQTYNDLRQSQGIPSLEGNYAGVRQTRRDLPINERVNSGNAGVQTEGQLNDQTFQKDIPLGNQEANMLDRLKLAYDFVNNSVNLKEKDYNASKESLLNALGLVSQAIDFSHTNLSDLYQRKQQDQVLEQQAQQFAIDNAIDQPYYQVGNNIYDTATRTLKFINNGGTIVSADGKAYSTPDQFFKDSGIKSFDQIYHLNSTTVADKNAVLDLRQKYPDAGILPTDSFTVASSKLDNSRIYQDSVRGPVGSGGGGGGVLGLTNQQIDNISPLVTQFQNSDIVKNYNVLGESYNFVNSLSNKTTNPSDDQGLVYALAKALDPSSAVREGEYATVQKYAQSMVNAYGKSVTQALNGTGFLSEDARKNIKSTITSRFKASETSYKNLYNETERRVNLIGNTDKGNQLLNNYGGAFAPTSSPSSSDTANRSAIPASQETPQAKGFWDKTINWLFGD